ILVHPSFAVIAAEFFEEPERFACENGCGLRHVSFHPSIGSRAAHHSLHHCESIHRPSTARGASRLALAAMPARRLVSLHERLNNKQLYANGKNRGPPQAG